MIFISTLFSLKSPFNSSFGTSKTARRIVTVSVNPGTISTRPTLGFEMPFVSPLLRSSTEVGKCHKLIRSNDTLHFTIQAALVVMHALCDEGFVPGSFIDATKTAHSLHSTEEENVILNRHIAAFGNRSSNLSAILHSREDGAGFSIPNWLWARKRFLSAGCSEDYAAVDSATIAKRLWDLTEQIVEEWKEQNVQISQAALTSSEGIDEEPHRALTVITETRDDMAPTSLKFSIRAKLRAMFQGMLRILKFPAKVWKNVFKRR